MITVGSFTRTLYKLAKGEYGTTCYGRTSDHSNTTGNIGDNYGQWYDERWHFDCSGLLNSIIWGWNGNKNATYGGADIASNNWGEHNDAMWHTQEGSNWSSNFSTLTAGEILWKEGHVGAYVGHGISVECSGNGVVFNNSLDSYWQEHCKASFIIDYSNQSGVPTEEELKNCGITTLPVNDETSTNTTTITHDLVLVDSHSKYDPYSWHVETVEETKEVTRDYVENADQISTTRGTSLLSAPSLIETPFVKIKIGNFTFGSYSKKGDSSSYTVTFPNYIQSAEITKVNGQVNTYVFQLVYAIEAGQDPNLLEKIFSSVGYGTVLISYGDYSSPNFIYKEEEAIITNLTSNVDFASSKITYTLNCTSSVNLLAATSFSFPTRTAKPSNVIKELLTSSTYGMKDVFPGMYAGTDNAWNKAMLNGWIATDDQVVTIEAKNGVDPLTYINYLVTCMIASSNDANAVIQDSNYYMAIHDDGINEFGGSYFTITKVASTTGTLSSTDTYEVDIGYPNIETNGPVIINFQIDNTNTWSLLYNYADKIQEHEYVYKIDNNGDMYTEYSPAASTSTTMFLTTPSQKTWWTQMTQFPIKATLTLKGLTRAAMLMTYVRINALFYGQRHISSGLYIVTAQKDSVSASGYRTTLSLTRIAGDTDYISRSTKKITQSTEAYVLTENDVAYTENYVVEALNGYTLDAGFTNTWTDTDGRVFYEFDSMQKYQDAYNKAIKYYEVVNSGSGSTTWYSSGLTEAAFYNMLVNTPDSAVPSLADIFNKFYKTWSDRYMDYEDFLYCAGWIASEYQYEAQYWSYLAAMCPFNYFIKNGMDSLYSTYTSWGSSYAKTAMRENARNLDNENNIIIRKVLYLALSNLNTNVMYASGMCKENGYVNEQSIYATNCIYYTENVSFGHPLANGMYTGYAGIWSS